MKIAPVSINFHGYKNVVATEINNPNSQLAFIIAQLNDEGHPDLTEFKKAKMLLEQPESRVNSDVINIIYTRVNNERPNLFIDDRILFWGDELKWLGEKRPNAMSEAEYKSIEAAHLKAYTLFASLTKRMMHNGLVSSDSGMKNVINDFMQTMTKFTHSKDSAFELLRYALAVKNPLERIAEKFNQTVVKTMKAFF